MEPSPCKFGNNHVAKLTGGKHVKRRRGVVFVASERGVLGLFLALFTHLRQDKYTALKLMLVSTQGANTLSTDVSLPVKDGF